MTVASALGRVSKIVCSDDVPATSGANNPAKSQNLKEKLHG